MGHSVELLQSIKAHVEQTYPESKGFAYSFEESLRHRGARYIPDIVVRDQGEQIVCLVEIGYTRPEKLTHYRTTLRIGDVRWYDKDGNLHGDVTEQILVKKVQFEIPKELQFHVLTVDGVSCRHCFDSEQKVQLANLYDKEVEEIEAEGITWDDAYDKFKDDAHDAYCETYSDVAGPTISFLLFSSVRWLLVCYCDACDECSVYNATELGEFAVGTAPQIGGEPFDKLYAEWCKRKRKYKPHPQIVDMESIEYELSIGKPKTWEYHDLADYFEKYFGVEIDYDHFSEYVPMPDGSRLFDL